MRQPVRQSLGTWVVTLASGSGLVAGALWVVWRKAVERRRKAAEMETLLPRHVFPRPVNVRHRDRSNAGTAAEAQF
jgi:hypothetical protein